MIPPSSPPTVRETAWFVGVTLALAWGLGFAWAFHAPITSPQHRWWLIAGAMMSPGLVGLSCAWIFRREPPRAVGFAFTGWGPWAFAFFYPLVAAGLALGLAFTVRAVTGHAEFIFYQPWDVAWELFGHVERGAGALPLSIVESALMILPYVAIAFAYRARLPERFAAAFPRLPRAAHLARAAIFILTLVVYPGPSPAPGPLGEELGWRGYIVRRWKERPLVAAAITMPVWALFHLPVAFGDNQRGHPLQNLSFLLSIAVAAVLFEALYLWAGSIWPCVVLHFCWNQWNPLILGSVYSGDPGLFGGAVWVFNGEGVFGVVINGAIAAWLLHRRWRAERSRAASPPLPSAA